MVSSNQLTLNVNRDYEFLLSDSGQLMGIIDQKDILRENEVFIQIQTNYFGANETKVLMGTVLIAAYDCMYPSDIQKFKCV